MSPLAEVMAWVSTAVGGMLVSGAAGSFLQSALGLVVLTVGLTPLSLQSVTKWREQRFDDRLDARERIASSFAKDFLSDAAAYEAWSRRVRTQKAREGIETALDAIHRQLYDGSDRMRVCYYELATDGESLQPVDWRGRRDQPRPFDKSDERGTAVLNLLIGSDDSYYVADAGHLPPHAGWTGRPYKTFVRLPIRSTEEAFGLLTVDSTRTGDLSDRDAILLEAYAAALAFYLAAAKRGERKKSND